jgi:hypothetical protein
MQPTPTNGFLAFVPLLIISVLIAIPAHLLAKDKGRNVTLWTVLGLIPLVNYVCMFFFVGASNLRLEKKSTLCWTRIGTSPVMPVRSSSREAGAGLVIQDI